MYAVYRSARRGVVRVAVVGGDGAVAAALRAHADLAARRPHDAPQIRFYVVPYGTAGTYINTYIHTYIHTTAALVIHSFTPQINNQS
jgi:hypothetical protein